jgi:hypothetical protein
VLFRVLDWVDTGSTGGVNTKRGCRQTEAEMNRSKAGKDEPSREAGNGAGRGGKNRVILRVRVGVTFVLVKRN